MRFITINGDPRGKQGETNVIVKSLVEGVTDAGSTNEDVCLANKDIKYCRGCYICRKRYPHECVIEDDMKALLDKIINSDVIIFATPVFNYNITGQMKVFMDRTLPLIDIDFEKNSREKFRSKPVYSFPKIITVATCETPGEDCFDVIRLFYKRFSENMNSEIIAEFYMNMSKIFSLKSRNFASIVEDYKHLLRIAGRELGNNLQLSRQTIEKLKEPLVPLNIYIEYST